MPWRLPNRSKSECEGRADALYLAPTSQARQEETFGLAFRNEILRQVRSA